MTAYPAEYIGSYEDIAYALRLVCTDPAAALEQFFGCLVLQRVVAH